MTLKELRKEIDLVDDEIIKLLDRRTELAFAVGKYKKENGISVENKERENEIRAKIKSFGLKYPDSVLGIYGAVFEESKKVQ